MSLASDERKFLRLEAELDAAVLDASRWVNVCDTLAAAVEGAGTVLIPFEERSRVAKLVISDAASELIDVYIKDGWYKYDYRESSVPIMKRRGYATDYDVADREVLCKHPYYAGFMTRLGFGPFIGVHIPTRDGGWCAAIQRPIAAGPPDAGILERVPRLREMLAAGVRSAEAMGATSVEQWCSRFDSTDRGFALLGRDGRVCRANLVAETLLAPFLRAGGELVLPHSAAGAHLTDLIARACSSRPRTPLPAPALLPMASGSVLAVDVVPLPSTSLLVDRILDRIALRSTSSRAHESCFRAGGPLRDLLEMPQGEVGIEDGRVATKMVISRTGAQRTFR